MAVTYYNQTVLGGTSYPRYADPLVTGKSNADGLYPWSTFRARFASITSGVVGADIEQVSAAGPLNLLLFTSDIPASGYICNGTVGAPLAPVSPTSQVGTTGFTAFFKATPAGTNVIVAAGQVGVGYSYNAGATTDANKNIYVAGFPAVIPGTTVAAASEVCIWTNSPNISSPVSFQNWDTVAAGTAATSGALPIILNFGDYTQAIRDAGNVFVNTAAPIGVTYQVVGLWSNGPA